jgi:hypothetical protein
MALWNTLTAIIITLTAGQIMGLAMGIIIITIILRIPHSLIIQAGSRRQHIMSQCITHTLLIIRGMTRNFIGADSASISHICINKKNLLARIASDSLFLTIFEP